MLGSRRIKAVAGDVLRVNGYDIDISTLIQMLQPDRRVLWAIVRNGDGDVQPVPYDETRVIWLTDEDLVRSDKDL